MQQALGRDPALVIGVTGGIASGKSTVARLVAEEAQARWGGPGPAVVDADRLARDVTGRPDVVQRIGAAFGETVLDASGRALDRGRLAEIVFADPDRRAELEAIVHPAVHAAIEDELGRAEEQGRTAVLDVPLLHERGWAERCDRVVFVEVPEAERERRALARGWESGERARRESAQLAVDEKRRRADAVVENDGPVEHVRARIRAWLDGLG